MRRFITFAAIFLTLCTAGATRYLHRTGTVRLRVDDVYPLGFVEFRYNPMDTADVLWRAFLAMSFYHGTSRVLYSGRANDEGNLAIPDFFSLSPLELFEDTLFDSTMVVDSVSDTTHYDTSYTVDTIITQAESRCSFISTDFYIEVEQVVSSHYNGEPFVKIIWIIRNNSSDTYTDGRFVFHFDGDVPDSRFDDDVAIGFPEKNAACQMASPSDSTCVGFIWLSGGWDYQIENTLEWFDRGLNNDSLFTLIDGNFWAGSEYCDSTGTVCPVFVDSLYGDVGVGIIFSVGDLPPGAEDTLEFYLAAAPNPDSFYAIADTLVGIHERAPQIVRPRSPEISAYPNPFNGVCEISCPGAVRFDIFDIRGGRVLSAAGDHIRFDAAGLRSGIYLIRATGKNFVAYRRIIYLK